MILRNTAGQSVLIGPLLLVADGSAVTSGATIKTRISGTTASGGGTLTHISGGVWEYAPTQAETDTAVLGLVLEGTGATSVPLTVPTTRFPAQTADVLPSVAAGSSGGVPLIGSAPLTNLDAAVSSRLATAGYAAPPSAGDNATAVWASGTRTLTTSIPTAAQIADGILGRNVAGGSDGGRTVSEALYTLRNRVVLSGGTMTVYATDDTTAAWTGTYTTDAAAEPIVGVDPA